MSVINLLQKRSLAFFLICLFILVFVFFSGCNIEKGRINVIDIEKIKADINPEEKENRYSDKVDMVDIVYDIATENKTVEQKKLESEKEESISIVLANTTSKGYANVTILAVKGKDYDYEVRAKENDNIKLDVIVEDPDKDEIEITYSSPFSKEGTWQTKEGDAGEYFVTVSASDGKSTDKKLIKVIIDEFNHAPIIDIKDNFTFREGDTIVLKPKIKDIDDDNVTLTYSGFMTSEKKELGYDEAGTHIVTITASDGRKKSEKSIKIFVLDKNRAPVIEIKEHKINITETELARIDYIISDPDKDELRINFTKPFNQTGEWQTKEGDAGRYEVKISASDGKLTTTDTVTVIVNRLNHPPEFVISSIKDIVVEEGDLIYLTPQVKDKDNDPVTITYSGWMKTARYQTGYDDAGVHEVTITASDGKNQTSKTIKITVKDVNRPPQIKDIKVIAN